MKKLIIFATLISFTINIFAQEKKNYYESVKIQQSFANAINLYGEADVSGYIVRYKDYSAGTLIKSDKITIKQGIGLARIASKAPSLFKLSKEEPNAIITDQGTIFILWDYEVWNILHNMEEFTATKGIRIFSIYKK